MPRDTLEAGLLRLATRLAGRGSMERDDLYQEGWLAVLETAPEELAYQLQAAKRGMQRALTREQAQHGLTWQGVERQTCQSFWQAAPPAPPWRHTLLLEIIGHLLSCSGVYESEKRALIDETQGEQQAPASRYAIYRCRRHLRHWLEDNPCTHRSMRRMS